MTDYLTFPVPIELDWGFTVVFTCSVYRETDYNGTQLQVDFNEVQIRRHDKPVETNCRMDWAEEMWGDAARARALRMLGGAY